MAFDGTKSKNKKKKNQVNSDSSSKVTNQTVRPFNFGGGYKQANNRAKGGLAGTGGAVFT